MINLPLVALVGRPNVGKSTLFNRILGARLAIVEDFPGTTRDRLYAHADWAGRAFTLVDTGGLEIGEDGEIEERVRNQALVAIREADVIVFLVDAIAGLTSGDHEVAELLRRSGKPIVIAVNKAEKQSRAQDATEFWSLALGEPHPVSALHGRGSGDLLDAIVEHLPEGELDEEEDERLRIAIVGRPNAGKSSLLNKITGSERAVVSEIAGTTRDAVDTVVSWNDEDVVLVDTAGIRRRGRIEPGIERYAVLRAVRALERSDVAILLIDASDGVTAQDAHIGGAVAEAGVGAIIAVNKWDLIDKDHLTAMEMERVYREDLKFLEFAPVIFLSALTGQRTHKLIGMAQSIQETRERRIPTGELNRFVAEAVARHEIARHGRALKIRYATQAGVAPPTFVFFVNDRKLAHFSYQRYLENQLRERFGFEGTPIRMVFREGERREREDAE